MSTNNSVPGMVYPQEKPMLAGNPKDSSMAATNQAATRHAELIKATSGGNNKKNKNRNKKYKYGGANGTITVPQYQLQYNSTGANGQTPNDIIKQNASISTQGSENAKYDNLAKMGGSRKANSKKYKKGGNSDWKWGCYSGGKKYKKTHKKLHKKNNKKTRKH